MLLEQNALSQVSSSGPGAVRVPGGLTYYYASAPTVLIFKYLNKEIHIFILW